MAKLKEKKSRKKQLIPEWVPECLYLIDYVNKLKKTLSICLAKIREIDIIFLFSKIVTINVIRFNNIDDLSYYVIHINYICLWIRGVKMS